MFGSFFIPNTTFIVCFNFDNFLLKSSHGPAHDIELII